MESNNKVLNKILIELQKMNDYLTEDHDDECEYKVVSSKEKDHCCEKMPWENAPAQQCCKCTCSDE